ncbi:MAG: hypothetical protein ACTSYA_02760 [Candidatus Kariarchaeaceae archaeon]
MESSETNEDSKKEMIKNIFLILFSHHPLCGYYDSHTFNIKGFRICKGCTMGYSGLALGLCWGFSVHPDIFVVSQFLIANLIYFLIVELIEIYEPFKLFSRFLTGMCAGLMIFLIFTVVFWLKFTTIIIFILLANFIAYFRYLSFKRNCSQFCKGKSFDSCENLLKKVIDKS